MMIDIASALSYEEFDDIKDYKSANAMWKKIKEIYWGDDNVRRAKVESLRGQFDQMKMREDENIAKYVERIKASVSAIKASGCYCGKTDCNVLDMILQLREECLKFKKGDVKKIIS